MDADRSLRQIALQPSPNARDLLRPPAFGVASHLSRVASVRPRCRCSARTLASSARVPLPRRSPFPCLTTPPTLSTGALLAPLFGGAEYLVALGCGALVQGTRGAVCGASHQRASETRLLRVHVGPVGSGMEPQPELYVTGALAVVAIMLHDSAKQRKEAPPARRKRR